MDITVGTRALITHDIYGLNTISLVVTDSRGHQYSKDIQIVGVPPALLPSPPEPVDLPTVSLSEYNQVHEGMSHSQVSAILGGPGIWMGKDNPSWGTGDVYGWGGEGGAGANAAIKFISDVLVEKAQDELR